MHRIRLRLQEAHRREADPLLLHSYDHGRVGRVNVIALSFATLQQFDHVRQRLGGELESQVAVEGRRHAALLHVAEHVGARRKHTLTLFFEQIEQKVGAVVLVCVLVTDEDSALEIAAHLLSQVMYVVAEVVDGEGLLENVGLIGARRQARQRSQVATVAAHGLDDEDASVRADGRLLDLVTDGHYFIKGRVTPNGEVSARHVVGYGGRHAY